MARKRIRYLTERTGPTGPRYFWQPSTALRVQGWQLTRLPDDFAQAVAAAEQLNARVDAWRAGTGEGPRGEPPGQAPGKAAAGKMPRIAPGSVDALISAYRASRFWLRLSPKTQCFYAWCLEKISAWAGDAPASAITPALVERFYQRLQVSGERDRKETPAKAAAVIRVLRLLLEAGRRLEVTPGVPYVTTNAAARPGLTVKRQREPRLWSAEDIAAMVAAADRLGWRSVGTAILLNSWIGQRLSDVLALPRWDVTGGALVFRQSKTGRTVSLPVHLVPALVERLTAEAARPGAVQSATHALVHDVTGKPWRADTFGHVFGQVRAEAAKTRPECAGLWFMELRHTAVTRLHEAGVDALGIASITGHSEAGVLAILGRHYLVRTARAAERAFRQRLAIERAGEKVLTP
jgi:integrase